MLENALETGQTRSKAHAVTKLQPLNDYSRQEQPSLVLKAARKHWKSNHISLNEVKIVKKAKEEKKMLENYLINIQEAF